ncbi:MAG: hypothetical protein LUI07_08935 [Lachnospiraceae bacterium]|nr:hypothetical protein [Lachnospiraceae bacterium]
MKKNNDGFISFIKFLLLGLAIALVVVLLILAFNIYRSSNREIGDENLVIVDDTEALTELSEEESETELETEPESETEQTESETVQTESETEQTEPETVQTESETEPETMQQTQTASASETSETTSTSASVSETSSADEEIIVIEGQETVSGDTTETTAAVEESTGDYRTLLSACNFRSAADYVDENGNDTVICSYEAGTSIELLEDLGGWARVRINGVVGYVGSQFVSAQ